MTPALDSDETTLTEHLDDTIARAVNTRGWQRLCVRYAKGTDRDRRRIHDVLGAGDRLHFELAWASVYGPATPIPEPEASPVRRRWWRLGSSD